MRGLTTVVFAVLAAFAFGGMQSEECTHWNDEEANVAFPERLGDMKLCRRDVYGEDDYSLLYNSRGILDGVGGRYKLTVYLFRLRGVELESDGLSPEVIKEVRDATAAIEVKVGGGEYSSVRQVIPGKRIVMPATGVDAMYSVSSARGVNGSKYDFCAVLVFAYKGRFIKLRYTEAVDRDGVEDTPNWQACIAKLDELIKRGADDHAVDVYAIKDDAERLAALKRKWVAAGDRVSMWDMPDYLAQFKKIDSFREWCEEDASARYPQFEVACRDAIDMKIEPAAWYYNMACAVAVQGRADVAVENLEKAVAAGYDRAAWAEKDGDLAAIRGDGRLDLLFRAMRAHEGRRWNEPQEDVVVGDGSCPRLTERNVFYAFDDESFFAMLDSSNENAIVYLNRHENHPDIPVDGVICPVYEESAKRRGLDKGFLDIRFPGATTIGASDFRYDADMNIIGETASIPVNLGTSGILSGRAVAAVDFDAIGVYAAGEDYVAGGTDRFPGNFPWCVANAGGAEESDRFVRLLVDIVRALPSRKLVAYSVIDILRRSQNCVKSDTDLLNGIAQRPVLRYDDIDAKRAVAIAKTAEKRPLSPMFNCNETGMEFSMTPICDLWESPWDRPVASDCPICVTFIAHWGEYTARFKASAVSIDGPCDRFEWRVLQGDPAKVRILPQDQSNSVVKLEVDYHEAFDADLPGGRKIKTSRVDIGCFVVRDGKVSVPAMFSVFFNPNEKRTYDKNHRLVSVDYTRRQIRDFAPFLCAKGDWKDVFAYDGEGNLTGWTRYLDDGKGVVTTNRFTREGLVIDSVDSLGRPKDVHHSLRSRWMQSVCASNLYAGCEVNAGWFAHCGREYDEREGSALETTLAWKYAYADDADHFGKPSPKEPTAFRYRPELCRRAEFTEDSGFRFPLLDQMEAGYDSHVAYRHDIPGTAVGDLSREDSRPVLESEGLVPPATLKKMRFCPWKGSTNDVWHCDQRKEESECGKLLVELSDGVYRYQDGEDGYITVGETYRAVNRYLAANAFERLDALYPRCSEAEVKQAFSCSLTDEEWNRISIAVDGGSRVEELPDGKGILMAMWRIGGNFRFSIVSSRGDPLGFRNYELFMVDREGVVCESAGTTELPSRAIGNTLIGKIKGDAESLNNYAVLRYCGVACPGDYDEESVIVDLESSARAGCATAKYNLGVLYENRGERREAERYYEEARAMGFAEK